MASKTDRRTVQRAAQSARQFIQAHKIARGGPPPRVTVMPHIFDALEFSARNNCNAGRFMHGFYVEGLHQYPDGRLFLDEVELVKG